MDKPIIRNYIILFNEPIFSKKKNDYYINCTNFNIVYTEGDGRGTIILRYYCRRIILNILVLEFFLLYFLFFALKYLFQKLI